MIAPATVILRRRVRELRKLLGTADETILDAFERAVQELDARRRHETGAQVLVDAIAETRFLRGALGDVHAAIQAAPFVTAALAERVDAILARVTQRQAAGRGRAIFAMEYDATASRDTLQADILAALDRFEAARQTGAGDVVDLEAEEAT